MMPGSTPCSWPCRSRGAGPSSNMSGVCIGFTITNGWYRFTIMWIGMFRYSCGCTPSASKVIKPSDICFREMGIRPVRSEADNGIGFKDYCRTGKHQNGCSLIASQLFIETIQAQKAFSDRRTDLQHYLFSTPGAGRFIGSGGLFPFEAFPMKISPRPGHFMPPVLMPLGCRTASAWAS